MEHHNNIINNKLDTTNYTKDNSMGIYLHIPFCVNKCKYCDFLSFKCDEDTKSKYVDSLIKEIILRSQLHNNRQISTIFIGGGTPSILESKKIYNIINTISKYYHIEKDAEITIECNPGTLNLLKLNDYKYSGINRLSIGLQSANDDELKAIGRIHSYVQFMESYNDAIDAGFSNINIDLMSALPYQTLKSYLETLMKVAKLNPTHISAYSLILEEGTPLYSFIYDGHEDLLPDEDTEREMYYKTLETLESFGYHRYEISNYSKPSYECKHNLSYWERKDYLGMGLGASSLIDNIRYKNIDDLHNYIENSSSPSAIMTDITELSLKDQMEEYMFLGLRKIEGVSIPLFYELFGTNMLNIYKDVLPKLQNDNLIKIENDYIKLTPIGIDVSNYVLSEFLL